MRCIGKLIGMSGIRIWHLGFRKQVCYSPPSLQPSAVWLAGGSSDEALHDLTLPHVTTPTVWTAGACGPSLTQETGRFNLSESADY